MKWETRVFVFINTRVSSSPHFISSSIWWIDDVRRRRINRRNVSSRRTAKCIAGFVKIFICFFIAPHEKAVLTAFYIENRSKKSVDALIVFSRGFLWFLKGRQRKGSLADTQAMCMNDDIPAIMGGNSENLINYPKDAANTIWHLATNSFRANK